MDSATSNGAVVEIRGVSKRFPGVQALEHVSLDIRPGEVHAVAGENGAEVDTLKRPRSSSGRARDIRSRVSRFVSEPPLCAAARHREGPSGGRARAPPDHRRNLAPGRERTRPG